MRRIVLLLFFSCTIGFAKGIVVLREGPPKATFGRIAEIEYSRPDVGQSVRVNRFGQYKDIEPRPGIIIEKENTFRRYFKEGQAIEIGELVEIREYAWVRLLFEEPNGHIVIDAGPGTIFKVLPGPRIKMLEGNIRVIHSPKTQKTSDFPLIETTDAKIRTRGTEFVVQTRIFGKERTETEILCVHGQLAVDLAKVNTQGIVYEHPYIINARQHYKTLSYNGILSNLENRNLNGKELREGMRDLGPKVIAKATYAAKSPTLDSVPGTGLGSEDKARKAFEKPQESEEEESDTLPDTDTIGDQAHEQSEVSVTLGVLRILENQYGVATEYFKKALIEDPRNFIALEYLSYLSEKKGNFHDAIRNLILAKHRAPKDRAPFINFHIGRLYFLVGNKPRAYTYLKSANDQNVHITFSSYLLGLLYLNDEDYYESEPMFHRANWQLEKPLATESERGLRQSVHLYLGKVYRALGFQPYSIRFLEKTEVGDSVALRREAWKQHSEMNKTNISFGVSDYGGYNFHVLLPSVSGPRLTGGVPLRLLNQDSFSNLLRVNFDLSTSPTNRWSLGLKEALSAHNYFENRFLEYNFWYVSIVPTVQWWNLRDWTLSLDLEVDRFFYNAPQPNFYALKTGAEFRILYVPFQRWNWEAGASFHTTDYDRDTEVVAEKRSGNTSTFFFRTSYKAPTPRVQPSFGYYYTIDVPKGDQYKSESHGLEGELRWRVFDRTFLIPNGTISFIDYPKNTNQRYDVTFTGGGAINSYFGQHLMLLIEYSHTGANSKDDSSTYFFSVVRGGARLVF
ncbi:MAG: hypothetical protein AB7F43_13245 [Bacteriovoracia bacterium]